MSMLVDHVRNVGDFVMEPMQVACVKEAVHINAVCQVKVRLDCLRYELWLTFCNPVLVLLYMSMS